MQEEWLNSLPEAGDEMDELVARDVMGWEPLPREVPRFSTSRDAAQQVVWRMVALGYRWRISESHGGEGAVPVRVVLMAVGQERIVAKLDDCEGQLARAVCVAAWVGIKRQGGLVGDHRE